MRWIGIALALAVAAACGGKEEPIAPAKSAPLLVSADWLAAHRGDVVLVDMQKNRELYEKGHLPGAVHAEVGDFRDGDKNLAGPDALAAKLGALGIDENTHVVVYDNEKGRNAAWLWFTLRQLGHGEVSLLDGHMPSFAGTLETGADPVVQAKTYRARRDPSEGIVDAAWIQENRKEIVLLDSRVTGQYTAEKPKKGMKGGHIPGAYNVPWDSFVKPDGRYLDVEASQALLHKLLGDGELPRFRWIVPYCNSYAAAASLHFHLARLGYDNIRPYDRSMREWEKLDLPRKAGARP